eukprot:TRINITY_DN35638_c0_g1_i1.p1 TRINITY_DN35638_c0_g1~~TRINITY_DN35638_c0_g1_i1.p1  ORF type:complete len:979 (+),score=122.20 TRINITY_DN35638_c0_g1_i1:209-2938(+)
MAGVGLGHGYVTLQCLEKIFACKFLVSLDIGWNRFDAEVFRCVGELVAKSNVLADLSLDACASSQVGTASPIGNFVECLQDDKTLTSLSLASNSIHFRTALVIEDALDQHPKIKSLNVSQNPLGVLGIRSLLRLLSRDTNHIVSIDLEGTHSGLRDEGGDPSKAYGCEVFNYADPGSRYVLDLSMPFHRSLLRMLYKTMDRFKVSSDETCFDVSYTLGRYDHATKDASGLYRTATEGTLTLRFSLDATLEKCLKGIDDYDFHGFLNSYCEITKFRPDWRKLTPLLAQWKRLDGRQIEQEAFLDAISKDFQLSLSHLEFLCKASPRCINATMCAMFPTMPSDGRNRYLAMQLFPSIQNFYMVYPDMEALMLFNAGNPTGHYRLNLNNGCEFAVAQRIMLIDRWEDVVNRRLGRADTSARGNRSHFRNELFQGRPLRQVVNSVAEWSLPEFDQFEFDYMSSYRAPKGAKFLSDELWEELMVTMYNTDCRQEDKIKCLRSISHTIFITSMHMRALVGYFSDDADREEAFVMFYLRICDMHNQKQFSCRFAGVDELGRLRDRLGYAVFFPFLQPENSQHVLNFEFHDQRIAAMCLVDLSLKEKMGNLRNFSWTMPDGRVDPLTMGVPRSWAERPPTSGVFRVTYICSPEDRRVEVRKSQANKYGYYHPDFDNSEIRWWTGLKEPPEDVLDLLEFFISRYNHVNEAFYEIDGGGEGMASNSELTLREFESGIKAMECHKFKGPDESARINAIFRYLDPGGEGSVSLGEWQVLGQLWQEFELSIREFVQFIIFAFGENLEDAWDALDEDGGGEVSEEEFNEAVEKIGYFGPARVVFALLDGSDDGNISFDEFIILEKYKPPEKAKKWMETSMGSFAEGGSESESSKGFGDFAGAEASMDSLNMESVDEGKENPDE